jgi:hypothetical protein
MSAFEEDLRMSIRPAVRPARLNASNRALQTSSGVGPAVPDYTPPSVSSSAGMVAAIA